MLIYTVEDQINNYNKTLILEKTKSIDILKLESLKSAIKTLRDSHIPNLKQKGSELDLLTVYSFEIEDLEAHYITIIKYLIRRLEPTVLNTLYNALQNDFPILNTLLKYSHNPDVMIQNASRISLMTIFQNCSGDVMKYITSVALPQHITDIIAQLKQHALDLQHFYEKMNGTALEKIYLCYREELEYIDDILRLGYGIDTLVISRLFKEFIVPFILTAITYEQNIEHSSPTSCKIGLYLLSKLLKIITNNKMKDYIISFFLPQETQIHTNIDSKRIKQITKSLRLILLKYELDIDILYTLQILNIIQFHISGNSIKSLKFYHEFLYTLMKTAMQYKHLSNPHLEYIKLKLLTSILEPLTGKAINNDHRWSNLHTFFSQTLEILYNDICMKIVHNIDNLEAVIDEEYEIFTNLKVNIERILEDVNYLIYTEDYKNLDATVNDTKIALWDMFYVRNLHLKLNGEKETILPILKRKEGIGKILRVDNSIPCEKLTHDNHYKNKHFLKFSDRQLLILQSTQIWSRGLVVFNSYYRDIFWSVDVNNAIKIYEMQEFYKLQFKNISKPFSIQLKLNNSDNLYFIQNLLLKAKERQIKITKNKLKDLLQDMDKKRT